MAEEKRSRFETRVRLGFAAVALIWTLLFVWDLSGSLARNDADAQRFTSLYAESVGERIGRLCPAPKAPGFYSCAAQQVAAARDQQRAEQDLNAQNRMADWAFWMMLISLITTGVSATALWFVKGTLDATREAVEEARKATRAAELTVVETRKIGEAQVRGYLAVEKVMLTIRKDDLLDLEVQIANTGHSPLNKLKLCYLIEIWETSIDKQEIAGEVAGNKGLFNLPASKILNFPKQTCSEGIRSDLKDIIDSGETFVSISVILLFEFSDVFDVSHTEAPRFSRLLRKWEREKSYEIPGEQEIASKILGEVYRRKHRGEWDED
jgi:hypothetical protein